MTDEGGIPELLDALRWRWKLVLLIAIPLVVGAALYAESLPFEYEGKAIVTISPRPELNNISASQVTVGAPKYVSYVTAPATIQELAPQLDETPGTVEKALDASLAADTGDITIRVTLGSPEAVARIANAFADAVVEFSQEDELLEAKIVARSSVPSSPSGPPRRLMEAAALVVGLALGIAAAFLVERNRPRARTWRDIAVLSGYPVIGRLPMSRALRGGPAVAFTDPVVGAAVRTLRTNLERELGTEPRGVVAVTSAGVGEGKTVTAGLFATALARLDYRVLLIDADLRRAGLSRNLGVDRDGGLSGVLRGRGTVIERIQPGWANGLSVLTTATDADAGELLARNFSDVLAAVRNDFDVVVLDTPPLLAADDTPTISTVVDGVMLVVSVGSMAASVSETVLALRSLRARVWGVVANRLPRTGPGGAASYIYSSIET